MQMIAEFACERDVLQDEYWLEHAFPTSDLRVRVWDENLVTMEFIRDGEVIRVFRLCWNAFRNFVIDGTDAWFFEYDDDDELMVGSCVDEELMLQCRSEPPFHVILCTGKEGPEVIFNGLRGEFLRVIDMAAMEIDKLSPQEGEVYAHDSRVVH